MTTSPHFRDKVERSLGQVISWVQRNQYRAYEPADGNLSWLFSFTGGRVFPMRVLQQIVLRAPVNIRPLLGILPHESAIGRGYFAWGYLLLHRVTGDDTFRREAIACLTWLESNRVPLSGEFCWGDPYEYATRAGRRPYGEPLLIWSALIGHAILDAHELSHENKYLQIAESIGRWMLKLPVEKTETGHCLSYVTYRQSSIQNAHLWLACYRSSSQPLS